MIMTGKPQGLPVYRQQKNSLYFNYSVLQENNHCIKAGDISGPGALVPGLRKKEEQV